MAKVSRPPSNQEHLIGPWYRLNKRSQSLIYWKTIHHPSVHVQRINRSSSNQEHLIGPWYRLKKRSQSLIDRKTIHHPSVHVQRINRPSSFQERTVTPLNRTSHMHMLDVSYMRSNEVKRFVEYYILIDRVIVTSTSQIENLALQSLSIPQMHIRVFSVVFIV